MSTSGTRRSPRSRIPLLRAVRQGHRRHTRSARSGAQEHQEAIRLRGAIHPLRDRRALRTLRSEPSPRRDPHWRTHLTRCVPWPRSARPRQLRPLPPHRSPRHRRQVTRLSLTPAAPANSVPCISTAPVSGANAPTPTRPRPPGTTFQSSSTDRRRRRSSPWGFLCSGRSALLCRRSGPDGSRWCGAKA